MIIPIVSALAFLSGVLLQTFFDIELGFIVYCILLISLFLRPKIFIVLLCLVFGIIRVDLFETNNIEVVTGDYLTLNGDIVEEIDVRADHKKITVETEYGRVLASVALYQDLKYGDYVSISGVLERPSEDIDGFSYKNYLARYKIWIVMYDARVQVIESASFSPRGSLYKFKNVLERRLNRIYFEPEASFSAGLLLGSRKGMPDELASAFRKVGLTHIVAISGYNITLVIAAIFLVFSFLKLKMRVIFSTVAVLIFVILVGGSAAVVRAGIMGALTLWGLFAGRKSQVFFALLWSAVLMVLWNPYILAFDVGFQLSFASTFGLLVFVPILEKIVPKFEKFGLIREAFLLTMAAQITTFPFMAYHFHSVSIISPVANVLAAPFIPFAMLFSALSLIGSPISLVAWFNLKAIELVALVLGKVPYILLPIEMSVTGFVLTSLLLLTLLLTVYKSILYRAFVRCPG